MNNVKSKMKRMDKPPCCKRQGIRGKTSVLKTSLYPAASYRE